MPAPVFTSAETGKLTPDSEARRREMVRRDLEGRGVRDPRVLAAMREVPRERFVPDDLIPAAYDDAPLPIGEGQTISQPYVVALMAEAARIGRDDRVLEVGAGSGYAAAVLAELAREVWAVEQSAALARSAASRLERLGYARVHVVNGDGSQGLPQAAPFDAIIVSAAAPTLPRPLLDQLAPGGRLVIPVGERDAQSLYRLTRTYAGTYDRQDLGPVAFVPLLMPEAGPR